MASGGKFAKIFVALLAGLGSVLAGRPVAAYCRTTACPTCALNENGCPTGTPLAWPSSCISFSMQVAASSQADLPTASRIMENAFGVWQNVACPDTSQPPSIHLANEYGNVGCDLHEYNQTDGNANIIMFRDKEWPYEGSANVLALTTVTYARKSGEIFDVDMEVNATQPLSTVDPVPASSYDLQSIVTHEVGHFLGLAHSTDRRATMWPQFMSGTDAFRLLSPDDSTGICVVYPPELPAKCDFGPRQGFSPECGIFPSGKGGRCSVEVVGQADDATRRFCLILALGSAIAWQRRRGRAGAKIVAARVQSETGR